MKLNRHYRSLHGDYLFSEVGRRAAAHAALHPERRLIRLGIGDVTRPLAPAVVSAMERAARELGDAATFRGYGPEQGYPFLRRAIAADYARRGVRLDEDAVFVNDGAKSDLGGILELFDPETTALIADPVYPVYADTNRLLGRPVRFLDATEENGFLPLPEPDAPAGLIYLCSPNNPTGAVYGREGLAAWVGHARKNGSVILFDAAYARFITDPALPSSIYEIPGAEQCAIEFGSFSKAAGFTGVRCGWTVFPDALRTEGVRLADWWRRRQATRTNGVSYVTQRGAEASLSPEGREQTQEAVESYLQNARRISDALRSLSLPHTGGENAPYVWFRCPGGDSWAFFDRLLREAGVIGTPGAGFGRNGQGWFRLSGLGSPADCAEAVDRLRRLHF